MDGEVEEGEDEVEGRKLGQCEAFPLYNSMVRSLRNEAKRDQDAQEELTGRKEEHGPIRAEHSRALLLEITSNPC